MHAWSQSVHHKSISPIGSRRKISPKLSVVLIGFAGTSRIAVISIFNFINGDCDLAVFNIRLDYGEDAGRQNRMAYSNAGTPLNFSSAGSSLDSRSGDKKGFIGLDDFISALKNQLPYLTIPSPAQKEGHVVLNSDLLHSRCVAKGRS